eukprot:7381641-Prymnesium_polylepis.1
MAYARLGAVQARLADASGDAAGQSRSAQAFEWAWRLQPTLAGGTPAAMAEFARAAADMALAGLGSAEASSARTARTVSEVSVPDLTAPGAERRAVSLWRTQGVVVFPALLEPRLVAALRAHAHAGGGGAAASVDRTANIRSPSNRSLHALPVSRAAEVLAALASKLEAFFGDALQSSSQLLLEAGLMGASSGAADQGWHRDDGLLDGRIASVQIALVDTATEQGALQVQPASHTHTERPDETAASVAVAVPAGSVTVYTPNVVHRGTANARAETRLTLVLTLMGASGLIPNGIPLAVEPDDAGRWWLEAGELRKLGHGRAH